MKIVLIYRKARSGGFSIEGLFHAIFRELKKKAEVVEYEVGGRRKIFRDVWTLRKMKADIYHVTGDVHYFIPFLPKEKTVLTVHDINHYLFKLKGLKKWLYKWVWIVLPIKKARAVSYISAETRDVVAKYMGFETRDSEVIENCTRPIFKQASKPFSKDCPAILHIGTSPHKNLSRLIEAVNGINCRLVLIGQMDDEIKSKLARSNQKYENAADISNEELYRHYVDCDIVSFISLREGFGMPIIEGQAVGRPVITSNFSPMSDVAGEGACLVDPYDVSDIRNGIERVISDHAYRDQLIENGFRNAKRFKRATISAQYLALYKKLQGI